MDINFNPNDFVWAKLQGFPTWPSIIVEPGSETPVKPSKMSNEKCYCVYFFGTHNYAWIEERHIKPYKEYKEKFASLYKTTSFKESVSEIESHIEKIEKDPSYKVIREKKGIKRSKTPKRPKKMLKSSSPVPVSVPIPELSSDAATTHIEIDGELNTKDMPASKLIFGVIGIGIIGSGIVKNLIRSGHTVNIWNRTTRKCDELQAELGHEAEQYLTSYLSPRAVMQHSNIVFNCVSDHIVSKRIIQNNFGMNNAADNVIQGKGLVEMTGIDPETSKDIRDMVEKKGGKYLEAQIQGSKLEACEGRLLLLTAGDKNLFYDCQSCFKAMGSAAVYLGEVGYATKMNLILQLIRGVCLVGLAEGLALAERCGVSQEEFINIFGMTSLASTYLKGKANLISKKNFTNVEQSLQNMQKDMKLGLELSCEMEQPMILASIANEIFKHCRRMEYGHHDASSIYMRNRH